jgi:hypothetical protein
MPWPVADSAHAQSVAQPATDASAPSIETLFEALVAEDWAKADATAAQLDAAATDKSLFSTFARATRLTMGGDCNSGLPLAQTVIERSPLFMPAYDLVARCLVADDDAPAAAKLYDAASSRLPAGPERDLMQARAQAFKPDLSPRYSIEAAVQPSTNVNRGTAETRFGEWNIVDDSRGKSGATAALHATVEKPLYVSKRLVSSVSLRLGASYDTVTSDVYPSVKAAFSNRWIISPRTALGATLAYEHVLKGGDSYLGQPSLTLDASHQLSPATALAGRVHLAYLDFADETRSGWSINASGSASTILSPQDRLRMQVSVGREERKSAAHSATTVAVEAELEHMFESGLIGSVGASAALRYSDGNAPGTSSRQINRQIAGTLGISHRDFMILGFRPELAYTLTRQWSNDVFSDYVAHDVGIRAKAAF